ncbi:hypothetical protein ACH4C6_11475 [Streptomyces sp. NPDC017943]|uniref:hypothetical protein n=1 Tax=Streptomyces sp. NPDC017943 TaxID=3365019 RepID=UPI00379ABCD0
MTSGDRGATAALHLLLVWGVAVAAVPALGLALAAAAWGGGGGAAAVVLAVGVPAAVALLAAAAVPAGAVVPLCRTARGRLGWAAAVFLLGTPGVLAGLAAYHAGVDLGGAGTRVALTGLPYAVAAAFFVPDRWVRAGAVAALAAGVAYGGFAGPAQARQRQHEAEVARYREYEDVQYLGAAPPGMRVERVRVGPAFGVEYRGVREDGLSLVTLTVRSPWAPRARCPELPEEGSTCTADAQGGIRRIRPIPGGRPEITLVRRYRGREAEVSSQTLGEPGLRRLLDTLRPLSDAELERLMRQDRVDGGF